MERVPSYCKLCRAHEIKVYGMVLHVADERHERACYEAGCRHSSYYNAKPEPERPATTYLEYDGAP